MPSTVADLNDFDEQQHHAEDQVAAQQDHGQPQHGDHEYGGKVASGGVRQLARWDRSTGGGRCWAGWPRSVRRIALIASADPARRVTVTVDTTAVVLSAGNIVEMSRVQESTSRAPMTTSMRMLSQRELTQGPSTWRSLHSSSRNAQAAGSDHS